MNNAFRLIASAIALAAGHAAAAEFAYIGVNKTGDLGTYFAATNVGGTYDFTYSVLDAIGNLVYEGHTNGFVLPDNQQAIFATWGLRNSYGVPVSAGTYSVRWKMVNTQTGSFHTEKHNVGVEAASGNMAGIPMDIITSSTGDKVYRLAANSSQRKAAFFLEGIDPLNMTNRVGLLGKLQFMLYNGPGYPRALGYDCYIVNWADGGASVATNAQRFRSIYDQIQGMYGGYTDVVVIGKSMGAVVARYALAQMETEGLRPPVSKFISIDAPQQGAQINLTLQASLLHLSRTPNLLESIVINLFGGASSKLADAKTILYSGASKDLLDLNVGLVEGYIRSSVNNSCVFDVSKLGEIRGKSSSWRDSFFSGLANLGRGGYPTFCKNYAIAYSPAQTLYTSASSDQLMANYKPAVTSYELYSDPKDLNQGSRLNQFGLGYSPVNGYIDGLVFVPLESAIDYRGPQYRGSIKPMPTPEDLQWWSMFDKIYLKANAVDHENCPDEEICQFVKSAFADTSPKRTAWPTFNIAPILSLILGD